MTGGGAGRWLDMEALSREGELSAVGPTTDVASTFLHNLRIEMRDNS
jgi:hypothetical protein